MTDLTVERLHARAVVAGPDDAARVRGLLADLAIRRLDEAMSAAALPPGDWYVRRLEIPLLLDPTRADAAIARDWARTVTDALGTALGRVGPDVVRFRGRLDATADLVAALSLGRPDREWAWRAAGAIADGDPGPASRPAETAVAALARDPARAVHALSLAVSRAGLPAVHRLLGAAGWRQVADIVLAAFGQRTTDWLVDAGTDASTDAGIDAGTGAPGLTAERHGGPLARAIAAGSPFAGAWRRSRLRPSPEVQRAWALLAAAEAEPALLRRPDAATVLAMLPAIVDGAGPGTALAAAAAAGAALTVPGDGPGRTGHGGDPSPGHGTDIAPSPEHGRAQARSRDDGARDAASEPGLPAGPMTASDGTAPAPGHPLLAEAVSGPAPARQAPCGTTAQARAETAAGPGPQAELDLDGAPTRYGGLVYLFATAAAAGIPDAAYTDDTLRQRPTSWLAFYLAGILAGPGSGVWEDPAVRAVAGLPPQAVAPGPEPTAAQRARLADLADRWAGATARAIGGDEDPRALVTRICSRTGRVVHDRGWIEFRLRLADVDLDVRRAGLDVDPGFVSWLGAVVVIRYE